MSITIKSECEIELMRKAGQILADVHQKLAEEIKPGMSTYEIDKIGEELIRSHGCIPSFLNYQGFPASICISLNDEIVHGIPSKDVIVKDGDIISLDAGVIYKGYHSDAARTVGVGSIPDESKQLIEVTKQSFIEGMKKAAAGNYLNDVSTAIGDYASKLGYGVVYDFVGHGIGTSLHQAPEIPNYAKKTRGPLLREGMTLAIEPMINVGVPQVKVCDNGWTAVTADSKRSAHYENTILITKGKPEILSLTEKEKEEGFLDLF